jgi:hypothetical protein
MRARTRTGQPSKETKSIPSFFDEDLVSIPPENILDEFRRLSRFLPVIVLIPKSGCLRKPAKNDLASYKSVTVMHGGPHLRSPVKEAALLEQPSAGDLFVFGEVTVSFSEMEVRRKEQLIALTRKEFGTLAYLVKNVRKVVSRDKLLNEVWGYQNYPSTRTVDNHILRLRVKLEKDPADPKHLLTVHGIGYKFLP